jgi:hypothetical protein
MINSDSIRPSIRHCIRNPVRRHPNLVEMSVLGLAKNWTRPIPSFPEDSSRNILCAERGSVKGFPIPPFQANVCSYAFVFGMNNGSKKAILG